MLRGFRSLFLGPDAQIHRRRPAIENALNTALLHLLLCGVLAVNDGVDGIAQASGGIIGRLSASIWRTAAAERIRRIAARGGIKKIADPLQWQREIRQDRPLSGREG